MSFALREMKGSSELNKSSILFYKLNNIKSNFKLIYYLLMWNNVVNEL